MGRWLRTGTILALSALPVSHLEAASKKLVVVSDAAGLQGALTPANAGKRIHVVRGTYVVSGPLVVPDHAILEGEGVMLGSDRPTGFESGTETRIRAGSGFAGDLIALGDGATLRGLIIEDIAPRSGNVVGVRSRMPADRVAASIVHCEIINPNAGGAGPDGPLGRGLVVLTQNQKMGAAPPPDEDAEVTATLMQSIIRSTNGGSAIFAINFASRGRATVTAIANHLFGSLEVTAGVSRPNAVTDATTTIFSEHNLYTPLGSVQTAWTIDGGSTPPVPGFHGEAASGNVTRFTSIGDRIDGFPTGIVATAAKRHNLSIPPSLPPLPPPAGTVSDSLLDLRLIQLQLNTSAVDIRLRATEVDGFYTPGDNNVLRALIIGVHGSGPRSNEYADEVGPGGVPQNFGSGNRLDIVGTFDIFGFLNPDIDPGPPAGFFIGGN